MPAVMGLRAQNTQLLLAFVVRLDLNIGLLVHLELVQIMIYL